MGARVVGTMKLNGVSQVPVLLDGQIQGVLTEKWLLGKALEKGGGKAKATDLASAEFCTVGPRERVAVLIELFKRYKVAFVVKSEGQRHEVLDIITRIDLIDFIASRTTS